MKLFTGHKHIDFTLLIIAIILFLTVTAHIVQAQDVTPAPVTDLTDKLFTDVETFLGTYGGIVGIAAAFVVGLLKNIPALSGVSARILNVLVSGVLVVGLLLATNFGYGSQFQAGLDALPVIGKALLALLVAFGFSTGVHEAANVYSVPVWGSKRTPS